MNILLLGFASAQPYHVMRCAAAAGHSVSVLGNGPAQNLLRSRACTDLYLSDFDYRAPDYRILTAEIAHLAIAIGFDLVMPSDAVATRALAAVKDEIPLPTTPLAEPGIIDTLNDPARFARFCTEHGMTVAEGEEINGASLGISVLCERGRIVAQMIEERSESHFRTRDAPDLLVTVARLMAAIGYDGIAQCDAVVDWTTGLATLTACRPGFPTSVAPAMIAGLNFAGAAIDLAQGILPLQPTLPPTVIKLYPAARRALVTPWRLSRSDRRLFAYHWHERALCRDLRRIEGDVVLPMMGDETASLSPRERLAS